MQYHGHQGCQLQFLRSTIEQSQTYKIPLTPPVDESYEWTPNPPAGASGVGKNGLPFYPGALFFRSTGMFFRYFNMPLTSINYEQRMTITYNHHFFIGKHRHYFIYTVYVCSIYAVDFWYIKNKNNGQYGHTCSHQKWSFHQFPFISSQCFSFKGCDSAFPITCHNTLRVTELPID